MYRKFSVMFFIPILVFMVLSGCTVQPGGGGGGGGGGTPASLVIFGTNSITDLNGKVIYTILSAQPSAKPEGNTYPPLTLYPFTLTTAASVSPSMAASISFLPNSARPANLVYHQGQISWDEKMRSEENRLLASREKQFSGNVSGLSADASAKAGVSIGDSRTFIIAVDGSTITATCTNISTYSYIYVDNRDLASMAPYISANSYGSTFDKIHATNNAKFGTENDVDGNGKVIIVFSEALPNTNAGLLGYFYPNDKYANSTNNPYSNDGDIIYITTSPAYQGNIVKATLAHEFQHMIYFDQHFNNGVTYTYTWLNEALSQAAEYYNGYVDNHTNWINSFLSDTSYNYQLSLTYWTIINYGYGALFIRYLIEQYGDTVTSNMCSTSKVGVAAVESATGADFNAIFNNFTLALVLSGTGVSSDPRYNFTTLNFQTLQPLGRKGLLPLMTYSAGTSTYSSSGWFPYSLLFFQWNGTFASMSISGDYWVCTAFGF